MENKLIYKKMSEVMKEIGYIAKDQKNQAQGFKFRGIDQFVNTLYPALTKHCVFMTPRCTKYSQEIREVIRSNGKAGVDKHVSLEVEYDFYAEDGSKVTVGPVPAEGLDSGDKATNKALSAALKYALIQTFSVPTEDMAEGDLESPQINKSILLKETEVVVGNNEPTRIAEIVVPNQATTTVIPAFPKTSSFSNKGKRAAKVEQVVTEGSDGF